MGRTTGWLLAMIVGIFAALAPGVQAADFDNPVAYAPIHLPAIHPELVSPELLQQGLSATYYLDYFERNLDGVSGIAAPDYATKKGGPILELNHQFGTGEVFGSGAGRGVAVRMSGYIRFEHPGIYQLQALSNDGVTVWIGGEVAIIDAEQHSDRLSNIGHLTIDQAGYYRTVIEYFQRKGTAALVLYWKVPGGEGFVPIPAHAYVHLP